MHFLSKHSDYALNFPGSAYTGTGSVSCNLAFRSAFLCRFLNQEELMEREAMVQNP
jgi:hypothetical protein